MATKLPDFKDKAAKAYDKVGESLRSFLPSHVLDSLPASEVQNRSKLFRTARLKLTGFYLVILIIFCLMLTLSLRSLAGRSIDQAGRSERGVVQQLFDEYYSVPIQPNYFSQYQSSQTSEVHHDLDRYVFIVNAIAVVIGGLISYWYAGRALTPIEEANEAQARFAADASHELRTPLAALKVENEVFLRQKSFKPIEAKELIKSNLEEVQRLETLATNLLALTQYETAALEISELDPAKLIEAATEKFQKQAKAKKIEIKTRTAKTKIRGEADSLQQLIGILLDNAIKYSPRSSKVYVDGVKTERHYHISVRDEGEGISEEDLPHIFDRLYRGDKSRTGQTGGYGLGLALGQEIANANGGVITARNYPDGGAQFVISLRLAS